MTTHAGHPAVLALLRDREAAARVADALRPGVPGAPPQAGAALRRVERLHELTAALAGASYALVVVEARDADGTSTEEAVRALRAHAPALPIVGYAVARAGLSADALALARAGVDELVIAGIDDATAALRAVLARATRRAGAARVLADVARLVPAAAAPVVRYCLEHSAAAPTVPDIARALGVSRQTLSARMRAAGLPGPRDLAVWCRLVLAADLLAAGLRSVDEVALTFDFPSGNALRNTLRRHAGVGPTDVRRQGAAPVLAAFRAALQTGPTPAGDSLRRPAAAPAAAARLHRRPPRPAPAEGGAA